MKILITGATGFIGKRLSEKFLSAGDEIYVLVRKQSLEKAKTIFKDRENIHFILGDVSNNDVLDTVVGVGMLPDDIECVIHLAAVYDLEVSLSSAYANNVVGTQNVIYLMQRMKNLKYYHHISTYAVSGIHEGDFREDQIESNAKFPDFYARTKMQAEYLVRHAVMKDVKVRIYRPGIIVGDSNTGEMDKIDGPYYFFRLFNEIQKYKQYLPLRYLPVSCHKNTTIPLLPVNTLVDWLFEMVSHPTDDKLKCYHMIPDEKIFITDLIDQSMSLYNINMRVQRIPFPELYATIMPALNMPKEIIPYIQSRTRYTKSDIKKDYPNLKSPPLLKDYLPTLVEGAKGLFK